MVVSDRRLTLLAALTGVVLAAVIAAGAVVGSASVAKQLTPDVEQALVTAGLEDVEVDVVGREVTVRNGTVNELDEALGVSERITGVRAAVVDDTPGAVDQIDMTRPYLKVRRDPDRLRILGAVPDAATAATIKASAARAFGVPVRGDLTIDPTLPAAGWADELPGAFSDMVGVTGMVLTVDGDVLELSGSIATASQRRSIIGRIARAVPSLTVASMVRTGPEAS